LTQDEPNELPTTTGTNENPRASSSTTPSRISFRLNPDGTRVSISRPPLPTNPQSPLLSSLRRVRKFFLFYNDKFVFFLDINGCHADFKTSVNISMYRLDCFVN
jgi:hypothetical protein